jgi:hypothetical protein
MIKRFFIIFAMTALLTSTLTVYADMIWSNSFLDKNRHKMTELERYMFVVDSESGALTAKEEPGSDKEFKLWDYQNAHQYENGQGINLTKVYNHNGEYWGIGDYGGHGGPSGWFPMNQLLVMYDRKDFIVDYENEFYNYTGVFDIELLNEKLVTWRWPGSDSAKTTYNFAEGDGYYDGIEVKKLNIHYAYKDVQEREWGYVEIEAVINVSIGHGALGKSLQTWDAWICLDDPANDSNIPSFNPAPEPKKWSPNPDAPVGSKNIPLVGQNQHENVFSTPVLISVVVVFVVSVVVLVLVFKKKDKTKPGGEDNN